MRIKLDENLPAHLAEILTNLQHDVHTIAEENLSGKSDREIWEAAQQDERFLITQDLDFSDLRRFAPGTHSRILLVRLHSPDRESLIRRVSEVFLQEEVSSWTGCFVVATDRKVRVIRASAAARTFPQSNHLESKSPDFASGLFNSTERRLST